MCFLSHKVAEKSLKAGMYITCDVGRATQRNPSIVSPAQALVQMGCQINISDAYFLENFSSHPCDTVAPDEKYTMNTAQDAYNAATKIYEAMKELVDD